MTTVLLWGAALLLAPYLIAKADLWRKSAKLLRRADMAELYRWWSKENMPGELQRATLFLNEQEVRTSTPVPMHGRVDQVFRTRKGLLIPVDTKARQSFRIYKSDIIQLSVYRVILEHMYGSKHCISNRGYVRIVMQTGNDEVIRYIPVRLLPESTIVGLWHRYKALQSGHKQRQCACGGSLH